MFTNANSPGDRLDIRIHPDQLKILEATAKKLRVAAPKSPASSAKKMVDEVLFEINLHMDTLSELSYPEVVAKISEALVSKLIIRQTLFRITRNKQEASRSEIQSCYDDADIHEMVHNIRAGIDNPNSIQAKPARIHNPNTPEGQKALIQQFGADVVIGILATADLTGIPAIKIISDGIDADGIVTLCTTLRSDYLIQNPTDQSLKDTDTHAKAFATIAKLTSVVFSKQSAKPEANTGEVPEIENDLSADDFFKKEFESDDY